MSHLKNLYGTLIIFWSQYVSSAWKKVLLTFQSTSFMLHDDRIFIFGWFSITQSLFFLGSNLWPSNLTLQVQ